MRCSEVHQLTVTMERRAWGDGLYLSSAFAKPHPGTCSDSGRARHGPVSGGAAVRCPPTHSCAPNNSGGLWVLTKFSEANFLAPNYMDSE